MKINLIKKYFFKYLYYGFAIYLPPSTNIFLGKAARYVRYVICHQIFEYCGDNVNIEKGASFGNGFKIRIDDNSGLGINCVVPDNAHIGKNVMMGPNCYVHSINHEFSRIDIPMIEQGFKQKKTLIIEDDVWIGRNVTIMVGRRISKGSIIAANCVLVKDFPEYSIVGGNPSVLIKSRLQNAMSNEQS